MGLMPPPPGLLRSGRQVSCALAAAATFGLLTACSSFPNLSGFSGLDGVPPAPAGPQQPAATVGAGQVRAALILPLSASGNAGAVAQAMRNAAEMALTEFNAPNVQLLIKDDGGTAPGAQQAAQDALDEGAEIIMGPLFAHSVASAGQTARAKNVPVIAFSTDVSVATRGVYLLSFLPETDVDRVIDYAASRGKRSFAALIPENAYGNVADAAFRQAVARNNGRMIAVERFRVDAAGMEEAARRIVQAMVQADALFIPGDAEVLQVIAPALATNGVNPKRVQFLGTGLWDDQRVYTDSTLQGGWFAAPEPGGFRGFSARYRGKYAQDPLRASTLAYDATSLVAALVKTQGPQRFSEQTLTNPSGFSGIDGIFRFKPEGGNERGLSVMRVTPNGPQVVSPAPKAFAGQT